MADPTKEPQEVKKDELSDAELNTATGGSIGSAALDVGNGIAATMAAGTKVSHASRYVEGSYGDKPN